jgi:hypothetical protein
MFNSISAQGNFDSVHRNAESAEKENNIAVFCGTCNS